MYRGCRELWVQLCENGQKRTIVCDVILPMGQLPTKGVPEVLEREAHSEPLGYVRDDPIPEERPRFRLGTVTDGKNLRGPPGMSTETRERCFLNGTDLTVLHHI